VEEHIRQDDQEIEHRLEKDDIPEVHYANGQGNNHKGKNNAEQYQIFLA
jgi:hypothetical protein